MMFISQRYVFGNISAWLLQTSHSTRKLKMMDCFQRKTKTAFCAGEIQLSVVYVVRQTWL